MGEKAAIHGNPSTSMYMCHGLLSSSVWLQQDGLGIVLVSRVLDTESASPQPYGVAL